MAIKKLKHGVIEEMLNNLSEQDKYRLFQCVWCGNDPGTCGADHKDEDEHGYCKKFVSKERGKDVDDR